MKSEIISNRLVSLRKGCNWTQQELASELGVSKNYIYMLEKGRIPGTKIMKELRRLEASLGKNQLDRSARESGPEWDLSRTGSIDAAGRGAMTPGMVAAEIKVHMALLNSPDIVIREHCRILIEKRLNELVAMCSTPQAKEHANGKEAKP